MAPTLQRISKNDGSVNWGLQTGLRPGEGGLYARAAFPKLAAMREEPEPPRKTFQLKPREFDSVNLPSSFPPPDAAPTDVEGHLAAAAPPQLLRPVLPPTPANDVQILLREEAARRKAAGVDELKPLPRRRSRRKRDYWLLLISFNAFFAAFAFGPLRSMSTLVYGVAGMIITTIGLTWVMWFVMDDY